MSHARAVLFDLDGTLVDTAPDMVRVLEDMLADRGVRPLPYDQVRSVVSNGSLGIVSLGFPDAGEAELRLLQSEYLERYEANVCDRSRLFPGLQDFLQRLDGAQVPWGVVTNKPTRMTEPLMAALGIRERAGSVVCGDTLPQRKPDPAPLLCAAREMGIAPEGIWYAGDAARDIEAGRAAGMTTVAVGYGYIVAGDDFHGWGADTVAAETDELVDILSAAALGH